jgi:hypothetical protein
MACFSTTSSSKLSMAFLFRIASRSIPRKRTGTTQRSLPVVLEPIVERMASCALDSLTPLIDYLHSKVIEWMETKQDLVNILSRDWKIKFTSSLVPRGMEINENFIRSLYRLTQMHIFNKFITEMKADKAIASDALEVALNARKEAIADRR